MCRIVFAWVVYSYFEKGFGKIVHATIPKVIGILSNLLLLLSFITRRYMSMTSPAILSNFFEKQWTQNHPQYLSGLSRALYPTTMYCVAFCVAPFRCVTRAEWNRDFLWQLFVSFKRRCCVMKGSCRGIMQFNKIDSEIKLYLSAWLL